jgi:hypothetical protein
MQPGRSGTYTLNVPSLAGSMITVYCIRFILTPLAAESSAMFRVEYRETAFRPLAR